MKQFNNILLIALGVVLLSACTKEPIVGGDEPLAEGTVQIKFALSDNGAAQPNTQSRAGETVEGDPTESVIYNLKVMFYNIGATDETTTLVEYLNMDLLPAEMGPGSGPGEGNEVPIVGEGFVWDPVTKVLTIKPAIDLKKRYKVVVIANWTAWTDWTTPEGLVDPTDYRSKVKNIKALDECFTNINEAHAYYLTNGYIYSPYFLPTISGATEHNFSVEPRATVPMIRQMVRIDVKVTLNADFMKAYPGLEFEKGRSPILSYYNMPNCSHIRDTKGNNPKFVELLKQPGNRMVNFLSTLLENNDTKKWEHTAYAYENLTFGKITDNADTRKNAPFMVIKLPYTLKEGNLTTTVTENYYKVYINDLSPAAAASPHKTVRNHLYRVGVEVNGFGGATPNDDYIRVTTEVLPWNSVWSFDQQGEFLKMDEQDKTITLGQETAIKVTTGDNLDLMSITSEKGNVTWRVVKDIQSGNDVNWKGTIFVSIKPEATSSEFVSGVDKLTAKVGKFSQSVTLNHVPCIAQRFARGMLVWNGSKVVIGAPDADPWMNLVFKFGRPMAMLPTSTVNGADYKIVYDPTVWTSGIPGNPLAPPHTELDTYFNPSIEPRLAAYYGEDKDYIVHGLEPNGLDKDRTGGDICRIISPDTEGHCWRIPMQSEWIQLLGKEGIPGDGTTSGKAIAMSSHPLQGSTGDPDLKFGWFVGPTAQAQTAANVGNPGKGSVFLYAHNYGIANGTRTAYNRHGTINIMSSSLENPAKYPTIKDPMLYATANGIVFGHGPQDPWALSFPVRCIRDYEREKTLPKR